MRRNLFWLSDEQWARIEPHSDVRGVERVDDRRVISGIVRVSQERLPLVRLPARGLWENLFRQLAACGRSAEI